MSNASSQIDLSAIRERYARVAAGGRCPQGRPRPSWPRPATVAALLADIPALCDEIDRLRALIVTAQRDHLDLVAAARATLKADSDGEPDPLFYLRDELRHRGLLPGGRRDRSW